MSAASKPLSPADIRSRTFIGDLYIAAKNDVDAECVQARLDVWVPAHFIRETAEEIELPCDEELIREVRAIALFLDRALEAEKTGWFKSPDTARPPSHDRVELGKLINLYDKLITSLEQIHPQVRDYLCPLVEINGAFTQMLELGDDPIPGMIAQLMEHRNLLDQGTNEKASDGGAPKKSKWWAMFKLHSLIVKRKGHCQQPDLVTVCEAWLGRVLENRSKSDDFSQLVASFFISLK